MWQNQHMMWTDEEFEYSCDGTGLGAGTSICEQDVWSHWLYQCLPHLRKMASVI